MRVIRRDGNKPDAGVGVNGTSGRALSRKAPVRQHPTATGFCIRPPKRYSSRPPRPGERLATCDLASHVAKHSRDIGGWRDRGVAAALVSSATTRAMTVTVVRDGAGGLPLSELASEDRRAGARSDQAVLAKRSRAASYGLAEAGPVCGRLLAVAGEHAGGGRRESSERTSASAVALRCRKT